MPGEGVSLPGLLMMASGTVLAYSGIQDPAGGPLGVVRDILSGRLPKPGKQQRYLIGAGTAVGKAAALGMDAVSGAVSASKVLSVAKSYLGTPYRLGGASRSGIDCSGLVMVAYRDGAGIKLPHLAAAQSKYGREIPRSQVMAGDLVYWGGTGTAFHIALVVDQDTIIVAPTWGKTVQYQQLWKRISGSTPGFRRLL